MRCLGSCFKNREKNQDVLQCIPYPSIFEYLELRPLIFFSKNDASMIRYEIRNNIVTYYHPTTTDSLFPGWFDHQCWKGYLDYCSIISIEFVVVATATASSPSSPTTSLLQEQCNQFYYQSLSSFYVSFI